MQPFFQAVRAAARREIWSRGVELARAEAVTAEHDGDDEVTLRVATRGGLVAPTVTLHLEDEEWECTCASNDDPCEHVAAATIALNRARKDGRTLPSASSSGGTLRYCLSHQPPGLAIEREIVTGEDRFLLKSSLDAIARGRVDGPAFIASQADLMVEHVLGPNRRGPVPIGILPRLFEALEKCDDVRLDGAPIEVSSERVLPRCRVVDAPGGFRLYLEPAPNVDRALGDGVVITQGRLRLMGEVRLSGRELQDLPRGLFFPHDQVAELLTETIPSLETRIAVEIDTAALPETSGAVAPRIVVEVEREGSRLAVLPLLVYGDPPVARVDADRLVHLGGRIPLRDRAAENRLAARLRDQVGLVPGHRVQLAGQEAVELADRLAGWSGPISGDAHREFFRLPDLEPKLEMHDESFDLSFISPETDPSSAAGKTRQASAAAVLRAWSAGESLVPLSGGGFAALPHDWLSKFGHRVADLLAAQRDDGVLPTSSLPDLGRLCDDLETPRPAALERLRPLLEDFEGIEPTPLPADFEGTLREYQRRGVDWLCFMRRAGLGALLADDMGLGKTVQALCALEGRSLVVCPTSLLFNWEEELRRFRPGLRACLYHGSKRELDPDADVTITSYAILRLDIERLVAESWSSVVLDEAQNIKNPSSLVAQAAFQLRADFRLALTGTPVENRLEELWSEFHFLNRGLLGGRRDFRDRYARPIGDGDPERIEALRERIRPFLLRRKKQDVAPELPPRSEVVIHCELSERERQVYDAVRAAMVPQVVSQLRAGGNVLAALEALLRLRQAACHPALVPGQRDDDAGSAKLEMLLSRLDQAVADGHKALVFSQWTSLLDLVEVQMRESELPFERLDGSTRNRGEVVSRFQSDDGAPVMLVSLKAGGTGLNLTAADHIFLLDPWWNPAVEDQAADRAHRIGQTRPVVVHRLVAQDTVEEGILELHTRKRALSQAALGGGDVGDGLTRDDLLAILG